MYNNIGGKIKGLAQFLAWLGIILSVLGGLVFMGITMLSGEFIGAILGIIIAVVGSLVSWLNGFLLYGFGQLIDNSDKIVRSLSRMRE